MRDLLDGVIIDIGNGKCWWSGKGVLRVVTDVFWSIYMINLEFHVFTGRIFM